MLLDPLTGVGNRTLGYDRLAHALSRGRSARLEVGVLYVDIDGFKQVNDDLGHAAGDGVLCEIGARLTAAVRESDTLARLGGDEFLVVCEDLDDDREVHEVADRVRDCFDEAFEAEGRRFALSASVGLAMTAGSEVTVDELIGEADAAMYRDKDRRPDSGRS